MNKYTIAFIAVGSVFLLFLASCEKEEDEVIVVNPIVIDPEPIPIIDGCSMCTYIITTVTTGDKVASDTVETFTVFEEDETTCNATDSAYRALIRDHVELEVLRRNELNPWIDTNGVGIITFWFENASYTLICDSI